MRHHWPRLAGQVDVSSSVKVVAKPEENASMDPIKPDIHVNITRGILVFSGVSKQNKKEEMAIKLMYQC